MTASRLLTVTAALLATTVPVLGQGETVGYVPPTAPTPIDPVAILGKLVGLTAFALAVCLGLAWANRRVKAHRTKGQPGRLEHRGSLTLTARQAVHLIRVDEHLVALTTDATGVRSMAVLSEPFEDVLARATASQTPTG